MVNSGAEGAAYVSAYGKEFFCGTLSGQLTLAGLAGEQEIVYVGLGSPEEIEAAGGVEGKIVLVQRGTLTFDEKLANADAAGAIGAIMFNNAPGAFVPFITYDFPLGLLTMEEGLDLLSLLPDGVHGTITVLNEFNSQAVDMAIDSSRGSTPDLRITPEISAPRDGITSAIGFGDDASYDTWSGTSMATPHVSTGLSLIKQYVRSLFPDRRAKEINELTYAFAMSTARQVNGFVRQQGAGLMDVAAAVSTEVYLSVPGNTRPKLELGEREDGVYAFSFTVNNAGDTAHTYTVVPSVMTEQVFDTEYSGPYFNPNPETVTVKVINGSIADVTHLCNITAPETVTVDAGESVTVQMTIACSRELMDYFAENRPSGMYLEGFIHLEEAREDAIDLSVPFLGFVGDWDYCAE